MQRICVFKVLANAYTSHSPHTLEHINYAWSPSYHPQGKWHLYSFPTHYSLTIVLWLTLPAAAHMNLKLLEMIHPFIPCFSRTFGLQTVHSEISTTELRLQVLKDLSSFLSFSSAAEAFDPLPCWHTQSKNCLSWVIELWLFWTLYSAWQPSLPQPPGCQEKYPLPKLKQTKIPVDLS